MDSPNSKPFAILMGTPSIKDTVYFCVAKGSKILHAYTTGDADLEAMAARCLGCAPEFHSNYFHTAGSRTFGFLIEDGYTYFAIVDPSAGNLAALRLLQNIKDAFKKAAKAGVHDDLVPVLRSLIASLGSMSRNAGNEEAAEAPSKPPVILGRKNSSRLGKDRDRDRAGEARSSNEREVMIEMPMETAAAAAASLQRSMSSMKSRTQQAGRRLWWRHVKIVIAVDVVLCLVLFGIWMAICGGFQCVSS